MPNPPPAISGFPFRPVPVPISANMNAAGRSMSPPGGSALPPFPPEQEQDFLARMAEMERVVLGELRSVKRVFPEGR